MDPMVSTRVPAELRDQVNEGLRSTGSSPTERIKADRIITRDLDGFAPSPIKARTPLEYPAWFEEGHGIVYDELDL